jgi:hypothetical protein
MLQQGRVDVLAWEYGHVWTVSVDTGQYNLQSTVSALDKLGYDSYLLGRKRMVQLNGNCWHPSYEFWWWSNIVTVRRDFEHHQELLRLYDATPFLRGYEPPDVASVD